MLVIRYQRTGRSGHAQYRLVVQDARRSPTSGKVVAQLGSYNPHTKVAALNTERIGHFLSHGAQPSERAALLLKKEGIKLPKWVLMPKKRQSAIKSSDKLRKNRPAEASPPKAEEATPLVASAAEAPAETPEPAAAVESETPSEAPSESAAETEVDNETDEVAEDSKAATETPKDKTAQDK